MPDSSCLRETDLAQSDPYVFIEENTLNLIHSDPEYSATSWKLNHKHRGQTTFFFKHHHSTSTCNEAGLGSIITASRTVALWSYSLKHASPTRTFR